MVFNIEAVRKFYHDPHLKLIADLVKRVSKVETDNVEIETDDLVGRGDSDDSYIRYNDRWNFPKKFDSPASNPQLCFEPDYNHLVLDLKFNHMGNTLTDYSGMNNHAEIYGEPCPASGITLPYRGGSMKSQAHGIGISEGIEYIVEDTVDTRMEEQGTGFSQWFVFNVKSFSQEGNLYHKYDDSNNGISVKLGTDANLHFLVENAGTSTFKKMDSATLSINTDYEVVVTHTVSGNVSKIYVNNVDKTLTNSALTIEDPAHNNSSICKNVDLNFMQHLRHYKDKPITAAQVGYLYTNKFTISNIAAGNVMILDGCVLAAPSGSFTTTSFTDTSFNTT